VKFSALLRYYRCYFYALSGAEFGRILRARGKA